MNHSPSVLIVDDEPTSRRLALNVLARHGYRCATADGAREALAAVSEEPPDVVVTDMAMPEVSGLALVAAVRERHPTVATVMLTAHDDERLVAAALDGGVYGYVTKPFEPSALLIAVSGAVRRRDVELENAQHRAALAELVGARTNELKESRAEAVERLALAVESRDPGTGVHIDRMSKLAGRIAERLGWDGADAEILTLASVLHDIGKIAVPDAILSKPGALDPEERRLIESHASVGHAILAGAKSDLLRVADTIAWTHHERLDGSGYPRRLRGAELPIVGRIAAVADVFDALTSDRPYRPAFDEPEALAMIRRDRGTKFDERVVDALLAVRA